MSGDGGTLMWDEEAGMNARVRKLIEQLGEAIHESVSESEQIAGVVQNIRSQGFDVLLMLEATIGLNEVETQPGEEGDASKPEVVEGGEALHRAGCQLPPFASHLH